MTQYDKHIKDRIYTLESDVPEMMWDKIDKELRPRRKRPWFLLLLFPFAFATYWSFLPGDRETSPAVNHKTVRSFSSGEITSMEEKSKNTDQAYAPINREDELSPSEISSGEITAGDIVENAASQQKTSNAGVYKTTSSLHQSPTNNRGTVGHSDRNSLDEKFGAYETERSGTIDQIREPSINDIGPAGLGATAIFKTDEAASSLPTLEPRDVFLHFFRKDPKIIVCPPISNKTRLRPFTELVVTAGYPMKSLKGTNIEFENHLKSREESEKIRSSLQISALVGIDIGDRFEFKAGLGVTSIHEVFDYIDQSATRTKTTIIVDTVDIGGVPQIRTDTSVTTEYGQRIKFTHNRYSTLDLPIAAAYRFRVNNHRFFIQGGAILNLGLRTRGDIISSSGDIVSIDNRKGNNAGLFRRNTGLDITGALGYEISFTESNFLRLMLSYRQALDGINSGSNPIDQRYKHVHLGLSWKHQF